MRGFLKIVTFSYFGEERQEYTRPSCSSAAPRLVSSREGNTEEGIIREEVAAMEIVSLISVESNSTYIRTVDSQDILADINDNDRKLKVKETSV